MINKQLDYMITEVRHGRMSNTKALKIIDQYAYEYAERVIGKDDTEKVEPLNERVNGLAIGKKMVGSMDAQFRDSLRAEQRKRNQDLSPHREKRGHMSEYRFYVGKGVLSYKVQRKRWGIWWTIFTSTSRTEANQVLKQLQEQENS